MTRIRIVDVLGGLTVVAALFLAGPASAAGKDVPPVTFTAEQIAGVAENPALLNDLVKALNNDQAVDLLIRIIEKVDTLSIGSEAKKNRVSELFSRVIDVKGAVQGNEIVARIVKKVNPRLLPIVRVGNTVSGGTPEGGTIAPPPTAPTYKRQ